MNAEEDDNTVSDAKGFIGVVYRPPRSLTVVAGGPSYYDAVDSAEEKVSDKNSELFGQAYKVFQLFPNPMFAVELTRWLEGFGLLPEDAWRGAKTVMCEVSGMPLDELEAMERLLIRERMPPPPPT